MMEVDAQTVIRVLQGQSSVKAGLSVILNDSLHLASCFNTVSFHFVSCDCNRVSNARVGKACPSFSSSYFLARGVPELGFVKKWRWMFYCLIINKALYQKKV